MLLLAICMPCYRANCSFLASRGGLDWILGGSFHTEGGDTLEQVAQGGFGCPISGGIQGQAGCGSGQPGLVAGNPAHCRGVETR